MAAPKSVWGLDIGQCALKAIKLREVNGQLQAEAFDIVEHPNVLSQPDVNRNELVNKSLEKFLSRNDVSDSNIAIAVPGQSSFTRFVKLPPVDAKKIPDLVRFEAEQQIPFDINEVVWRWQGFPDPDSPDLSVGLFAMKRQDVFAAMQPFTDVDVDVDLVQMTPLSLYNFMKYDRQVSEEGATLLVDIGADGTDLVVADGPRLWTRTIQLGGNDFTDALVNSFNLSFDKAEKLKRTAATSKYARQVFQSMRPVFSDLVQEIQRSIGYYTSLRRDAKFVRIVGVGNGFRLPGLQKFLEQNLNTPVARVDSFNALQTNTTTSAAKFTENLPSFAVAYGLAVQGLELTEVDSNLLPDEIASVRLWRSKRPWFVAAAVLLVVSMLSWAWREQSDYSTLRTDRGKSEQLRGVESIIEECQAHKRKFDENRAKLQGNLEELQETVELNKYNKFWPAVQATIFDAIAQEARDLQYANSADLDSLAKIEPNRRKMITMLSLTSEFIAAPESDKAAVDILDSQANNSSAGAMGGMGFGGGGVSSSASGNDAILITFTGRCPMDKPSTTTLLSDILIRSRKLAQANLEGQATLMAEKIIQFEPAGAGVSRMRAAGPTGAMGGMGMPGMGAMNTMGLRDGEDRVDPRLAINPAKDFTGADIDKYQRFVIGWVFKLQRDDSVDTY